jgi:ATP-dependent helicase/nuclease subunit A
MSTPLSHRFGSEVVRACAGAGKTTRLSKRIIKLLVNDVPPEEIIALTFTRAAAGEFVARLLKMLAGGASSPEGAAKLAKELELPPKRANGEPWGQTFFQEKLKLTLMSVNRMTLGTLDSFFAKIVNNNPTELGLDVGQVKTSSELDGPAIRAQITKFAMEQVFQRDRQAIKDRLSELKLGKESATPLENFKALVEELHETFLLANSPEIWGMRQSIWPQGSLLFDKPAEKQSREAFAHLKSWIAALKPEKKFSITLFRNHIKGLEEAGERGVVSKTIADNYLKYYTGLANANPGAGSSYTHTHHESGDHTQEVDGATCAAYKVCIRHALSEYFEGKSNQTQSAYSLLHTYDLFYRDELRKSGQLGFSDYINLLLSLPPDRKLDLEYRLDCKFRHWLFDEFQDTSSRQWKVLNNYLTEGTKHKDEWSTTYFVGDPKQSIFSWRGGNPRLLSQREAKTRDEYGDDAIIPLKKTFRCAVPIVDMVNDLLGQPAQLASILPEASKITWMSNFEPHESAVQIDKEKGEAFWVRLPESEDSSLTLEAQSKWIVENLKSSGLTEGRYLRPGFTCAILVSQNGQAAKIADIIRANGLEAADEAETPIAMDNPFTAGFVGILRNCAHPDDSLSKGLANMSPTAKAYVDAAGGWEACRATVADLFYAKGAAETLRELTRDVDLSEGDKATESAANSWKFLRMRLRQLLTLGAQYDEQGERDLRGAADYIANSSLRDSADPTAIQVLTTHRSKGLQYTAVYLPCLNSGYHYFGREENQAPLILDDPETFEPKWILHRPAKHIRQLDDAFLKAQRIEQSDEAYEALCKLYVGMTRAERRLVLITETPGENNSPTKEDQYDYAKMIEKILGSKTAQPIPENTIVRHYGDASWISLLETSVRTTSAAEENAGPKVEFTPVESPLKFLPSDKEPTTSDKEPTKRYPFRSRTKVDLTKPKGKDIGNVIHALMEPLEWDVQGFLLDLKTKSPGKATEALHQQAKAIIESCLKSKAVAAALSNKPEGGTILKERKFSLMIEPGRVMTGNADRIHLVEGKSAVIFDYKSDTCDIEELKAKHARQMDMYRTATSRIWGIPADKIQCFLIHVRKGELVEC